MKPFVYYFWGQRWVQYSSPVVQSSGPVHWIETAFHWCLATTKKNYRSWEGRQPHTHVLGEAGPSNHHDRDHEGGVRPSEASGFLGHHSQATTKDRSRHAEYDPDRYGSSSHSRHVGTEQFHSTIREPQQHQHHQHQGKSHQLDPHTNSSNKRHKHKGERGVRFQQWAKTDHKLWKTVDNYCLAIAIHLP